MKAIGKPDEGGYTLIELMVVLVIMGLMAAIAMPLMMRSMSNQLRDNIKLLSKNVEEWSVKNPSLTLQGTQGMVESDYFDDDIVSKNPGLVLPEYIDEINSRTSLGLVYVTDTEYIICYDPNRGKSEVLVYDPFNDAFTEYEGGCHR